MEAFDQTALPAWILLSPLATRKFWLHSKTSMLRWWGLTCFGGRPSRSQLRSPPQHSLFSKKHPAGRGPLFSANMADMWKETDASAEMTMAIVKWARSVQHWQEGIMGCSQDPRWRAALTMTQRCVRKRRWVVLWSLPTPGHECN